MYSQHHAHDVRPNHGFNFEWRRFAKFTWPVGPDTVYKSIYPAERVHRGGDYELPLAETC